MGRNKLYSYLVCQQVINASAMAHPVEKKAVTVMYHCVAMKSQEQGISPNVSGIGNGCGVPKVSAMLRNQKAHQILSAVVIANVHMHT